MVRSASTISRPVLTLMLVTILGVSLIPNVPISNTPVAHAEIPGFTTVRSVGLGTDLTTSAAVGDMDGDGDLDLVLGRQNFTGQTLQFGGIYFNDGAGNFSSIPNRIFGTGQEVTTALAVGDLDGDGDLDLVSGNDGLPNVVYRNDGSANLTPIASLGATGNRTFGLDIGDIDGDGDLDIVTGNLFQPNQIYLNDGDGRFPAALTYGVGGDITYAVRLGDIDGDGRLDIVNGNLTQWNVVYFNLAVLPGTAIFHYGPINCGIPAGFWCFGTGNDLTSALALSDMNGDGRIDIVLGNRGANTVYLATGFRAVVYDGDIGLPSEATTSIAAGDLDNDGDNDLLSGNLNQVSFVYLNNGGGGFPSISSLDASSNGAFTHVALLADFDGDGRLDVFLGNFQQQSVIYLSDRGGNLASREVVGNSGGMTSRLISAELNRDGYADMVEINNGQANHIYFGDGAGGFGPGVLFGTGSDQSRSAAIADINGDGANDIIVANSGQSLAYLNDGAGGFFSGIAICGLTFNVRCIGAPGGLFTSIAVGDLNGDGANDIVVGQTGQGFLLLNDGSGNFVAQRPFSGTTSSPVSVALADMDDDGDLDIVAGQIGQSYVYPNDGAGNFPSIATWAFGFPSNMTPQIAVADLNGDSRPDILFGSNGQVYAYLNGGGFTAAITVVTGEGNTNLNGLAADDLNGDGTADVAVTFDGLPTRIHFNTGNASFPTSFVFPATGELSYAIDVADVNSDGNSDLLIGNNGQQNVVWLGDGAGGFPTSLALGPPDDFIFALAMGDINNDHHLDLIAGEAGRTSAIFLNDGSGRFPEGGRISFGFSFGNTTALTVGDLNSDGNLDIVSAYSNLPTLVTMSQSGDYSLSLPLGPNPMMAVGVALADFDLDSDLDVVAIPLDRAAPTQIFLNDGSGNFPGQVSIGGPIDLANSVAVGDLNGDNAPDLVIANQAGQPNRVYLNDGSGHVLTVLSFGSSAETSTRVALGDMDGDGDLDAVVANVGTPSIVYLNDGSGRFTDMRTLLIRTAMVTPVGIALADLNGDLSLDIVLAKYGQASEVYLNDGAGNFPTSWTFGPTMASTSGVAAGDIDNDGDPDLALAGFVQPTALYRNGLSGGARLANNPPTVHVAYPGPGPEANGYSGATRIESQLIPIRYTLADREGDGVRRIRASYSLDGGGTWRPAVPTDGTVMTDLAAPPGGATYTFTWNPFASGFFGQSDNVVFRIEAEPSLRPSVGSVAGPFQRPYVSSTTMPFRVRGTQVRVLLEDGTPAVGAVVYRLPAGQSRAAAPLADSAGAPYRTDANGYLPGRNVLAVGDSGDRLVALYPKVITDTYTLYQTSAPVTATGLDLAPLAEPGVQTLTISPERPLLLFNLDVALEWDARSDPQFLAQLEDDLRRSSEILYDWTDGQVALGRVTIFNDAKRERYDGGWDLWSYANLRIYATNRLRPNANKGGIVIDPTADPTNSADIYEPGQIRMGAVWNRYGETAGAIGEDWPRTLAHELGHYLFALDETYLGLNRDGVLVPVEGCRGGMSDPYRDDYSELHPRDAEWQAKCLGTLAEQENGRSDWESVLAFYPSFGLSAPNGFADNPGPGLLPLAVTQISQASLITPTQALEVPIISLEANGSAVQPGSGARAFLFQGDLLTDLGRPVLDRVEARGAALGDRLCVFDPSDDRLGCEVLRAGDQTLSLQGAPGWRPEIAITPVTSRTLTVDVSNLPAGLSLTARLFPADGPAGPPIALNASGSVYSGVFGPDLLSEPVFEGFVQIATNDGSGRESVVDFTIGGNPGRRWARTAPRGSPGRRWARTAPRGSPGRRWARTAPVISSDGQVILYTDQEFAEGEFYSFQTVAALPDPPSWATPVGQAYRLSATANAPSLSEASISIGYLQRDVPDGEERWLKIYYDAGEGWEALPTEISQVTNTASAPVRGPGIYALMSSIEVQLHNAGWNLIRYPIAGQRPTGVAIAGLEAKLGSDERLIVYHDNGSGVEPRWNLYATGVPTYVNSLASLVFDENYYIWVPGQTTLPLRGGAGLDGAIAQPPASFYGTVQRHTGQPVTAGMTVTARIGTTVCGRSQTQAVNGKIVYVISVEAEGTQAGCGANGRLVTFTFDGRPAMGAMLWDDSRMQEANLSVGAVGSAEDLKVFIPLVVR